MLRRWSLLATSVLITAGFAACGGDDGGDSPGSGGSAAASGSGGGAATGAGAGSGAQGTGGGIVFDSGTGGGTVDGGCTSTTAVGELKPANLLFVIDRSGSMNCNLPSDGQSSAECLVSPLPKDTSKPTKWELTRDALKLAIDDLEKTGNASAGLVAFPKETTDCDVEVTPNVLVQSLDTTQNTALDAFLDFIKPKGETPMAGATILSYAYLLSQLKAAKLPGNTFVVLLTDGFETCKAAEITKLLGTDVPTAYGALGIRTFVIGAPGSENARALLSHIATAGGTANSGCTLPNAPTDWSQCNSSSPPSECPQGDCHFDMTTSSNFSQDLKKALDTISGSALSCELDVPAPPAGKKIDFDQVGVRLNGADVKRDDSAPCDTGADGWQFSPDKSKILLCGNACTNAKQPNSTLEVVLGCLVDVR
ncbi:MAG: vWA domain-containing protein [Polyangiaceae bacterium]